MKLINFKKYRSLNEDFSKDLINQLNSKFKRLVSNDYTNLFDLFQDIASILKQYKLEFLDKLDSIASTTEKTTRQLKIKGIESATAIDNISLNVEWTVGDIIKLKYAVLA